MSEILSVTNQVGQPVAMTPVVLTVVERREVDFGAVKLNGIKASDGNYYVEAREVARVFAVLPSNAARSLKRILGEGFTALPVLVSHAKQDKPAVHAHCMSLSEWDKVVLYYAFEQPKPVARELLTVAQSMTTAARFADAFGQTYGKEERDALVEKQAKRLRESNERQIKALGYAFQRSAGSVSQKREFLSWVLEGVATADLVDKELVDSEGNVLGKSGAGKHRSYTKLYLTDPEYFEIIRGLYLEVMASMTRFRPGQGDYRVGWVKAATQAIDASALPLEEKLAFKARAKVFFS